MKCIKSGRRALQEWAADQLWYNSVIFKNSFPGPEQGWNQIQWRHNTATRDSNDYQSVLESEGQQAKEARTHDLFRTPNPGTHPTSGLGFMLWPLRLVAAWKGLLNTRESTVFAAASFWLSPWQPGTGVCCWKGPILGSDLLCSLEKQNHC